MSSKTNNRSDSFLTESLPFATTLAVLGYPLLNTIASSDGKVIFMFRSQGKDLQALYEKFHLQDIQVPARQFVNEWRRLRRVIDAALGTSYTGSYHGGR